MTPSEYSRKRSAFIATLPSAEQERIASATAAVAGFTWTESDRDLLRSIDCRLEHWLHAKAVTRFMFEDDH